MILVSRWAFRTKTVIVLAVKVRPSDCLSCLIKAIRGDIFNVLITTTYKSSLKWYLLAVK